MLGRFEAENHDDADGKPAGGWVHGIGLNINWQNGPLGRGDDREEPNGAFVETVIAAVIQRIEYYQAGEFSNLYNEAALTSLRGALSVLNTRTQEREERGVEGIHVA